MEKGNRSTHRDVDGRVNCVAAEMCALSSLSWDEKRILRAAVRLGERPEPPGFGPGRFVLTVEEVRCVPRKGSDSQPLEDCVVLRRREGEAEARRKDGCEEESGEERWVAKRRGGRNGNASPDVAPHFSLGVGAEFDSCSAGASGAAEAVDVEGGGRMGGSLLGWGGEKREADSSYSSSLEPLPRPFLLSCRVMSSASISTSTPSSPFASFPPPLLK